MPRLSKLLEKLEDRLENKLGAWYERHREKMPVYVPTGLIILYFGSVTFSMGRDCIAAVPCQGIGFRLAKGDLDRNRHLCFVC